ncbi:MAG: hypothetical protein AAB668_04675 [Patescibacteria group bacterium]
MSFYANHRMIRHIRKAVAGLMVASIGASALQIPIAMANSTIPNPGWGTVLAIHPDTEPLMFEDGERMPAIPKEDRPPTLKTMYMASTSYTSRAQETDADPFVTADGSDVRDGIVATNVLPFGTKVRIPTVFGDRIFTVHDRMNARYSYRIDVWSSDLATAKEYGVKRNIPIEVVEYGDNKTQWHARAAKLKQERLAKQRVKEIALK